MTEKELENMDHPKKYNQRKDATMGNWLNIIFKMMEDGHSNETIFFYIRERPDFTESPQKLSDYIYLLCSTLADKIIP